MTTRHARYLSPILLCAALLLAACGAPPTVDYRMADARKHREKGDLMAAIIELKNVLKQQPGHAEARYLLGLVYLQSGDARAAEAQFREALNAKYDPTLVLPVLARALFEQAEFEKAIEATFSSDYGEAALQPEVLGLRGHAQLSLGKREDAAGSFDDALKRDPKHVPAILGKVRLAVAKGDFRAALASVAHALAADPSSLDAWLMKGDLERATGRSDAALDAYRAALALKPNGLAANLNLASFYIAAGKLDLARKHVDVIQRILPESALGYYLQGLLEFRNGDFAAANVAIQRVLKASPNYLPATALAGMVAYSVGAFEKAEQRLAEALSRNPGNVSLQKLYATALLRSGKVKRALELLEPLLKSGPRDPGVLALIAEAKFQNNDIPAARKYFELAVKDNPENSRVRLGLGLARLAAGETDRALADLEAAAEMGGSAADAFLVTSLISVKQYDKALEVVARLEKKRPDDAVTFNLKASVLFAKHDIAGARAAFERAAAVQPQKIAATLNLAQLDLGEGNAAAARKRLDKILERDKDNVPAMLALADLESATQNWDDAVRWAERARQTQPSALKPALALAKLRFAKGDYANAAPPAQVAVRAAPENLEALNILAYSQLRLGKKQEASVTYMKLVNLVPNSAEAHYGLAGAQSAEGKYAAAETSLKKTLELRPNFPEATYSLAALQMRAGKLEDARKLVNDAQRRMPKSAVGFVIAGDAAAAEKKYEQAVKAYATAFELDKSREVLMKLHGALSSAGRTAEATTLTADWLHKNPDDIAVRYFVADRAIRSEKFPLAAEQYQYALQKEPNKLPLLHNLGWVYERMNDPRAIEVAESAYKVAPRDPSVLYDLGRLLAEKGAVDRAIGLLEQARILAPNSQLVRYHLAKAYLKSGDGKRARSELEQLLRGSQEFDERPEAEALLKRLKT